MHFYATENPDRVLDLGLHDMRTNTSPFLAYVQLVPMPPGQTFAAVADAFLQRQNEQKTADEALAWRQLKHESTRLVTSAVHSAVATKKLKHDIYMKWALLQPDKDHLVLINFTISPADGKERERYDAAADAMVQSVQESKRDHR